MNGVLVIDKPSGFTSFDVVAVMRGLSGQRKIGHTGTLDPMATGVLPLLLGCATRAESLLPDTDKTYEAGFQLGLTTDTEDSSGKVLSKRQSSFSRETVEQALSPFRGDILQVPPMYSAIRKDGRRLYDLARQGIEVEREARSITIYEFSLLSFDEENQKGSLKIRCSSGTYVRTLCADLGETLGCGAVMTSLRRTAACGFSLADAIALESARALSREEIGRRLLPAESLFLRYPSVRITQAQAVRFQNGGALLLERTDIPPKDALDGAVFRVGGPDGRFFGLGSVRAAQNELGVLRLFIQGEDQ